MSLVALWFSSKLSVAQETKAAPAAAKCEVPDDGHKDHDHQLARIVGALCVSASLRQSFFGAPDVGAAKKVLEERKLFKQSGFFHVSKPGVKCAVEKMYAAHHSPDNYVKSAAEGLSSALQMAGAMPCPEWPC